VALDYFEKAGLDTSFVDVDGDCTELSRTVQITARTEVKSMFINLLGIDQMVASGVSTAEESTQDVEISLILDVSGSMDELDNTGSQTKLAALQAAANEFLDTLLVEDNEGRVSFNVIPYNMQVNAGKDILDQLNVTDEHDLSHCVDFEREDFGTVELTAEVAGALSRGEVFLDESPMGNTSELQRTGHFDPYYTTIDHPNTDADNDAERLFVCPISEEPETSSAETSTTYGASEITSEEPETAAFEASQITLLSENLSDLKERINGLTAGGNTSIDIGVKWGSYLLNPEALKVIKGLPSDSTSFTSDGLPEAFRDRPFDYRRENTLKIMVVMTDGINTTQHTLAEDYSEGESTLWWNPNEDSGDTWLSHYKRRPGWNNDYFMSRGDYYEDYFSGYRRNQGSDERLDWIDVWAMMGVKYFAYYYNYARDWDANEYYETIDDIITPISAVEKNERLEAACTAAKAEEVIIYTIGFEVSDESAVIMENCASAASNFYRVEGTEISKAFGEIANAIQRLKLTF